MKLDGKESINFTLRMPVSQRIELEKISSNLQALQCAVDTAPGHQQDLRPPQRGGHATDCRADRQGHQVAHVITRVPPSSASPRGV